MQCTYYVQYDVYICIIVTLLRALNTACTNIHVHVHVFFMSNEQVNGFTPLTGSIHVCVYISCYPSVPPAPTNIGTVVLNDSAIRVAWELQPNVGGRVVETGETSYNVTATPVHEPDCGYEAKTVTVKGTCTCHAYPCIACDHDAVCTYSYLFIL